MLEILNYGGVFAGVAGAASLIVASFRTNSSKVWQENAASWKEEAEVQKARADRLFGELEEIKNRLTHIEGYNATLVAVLSTIDPEKLEDLRIRRGL
jgi:hypothetical protein